MVKCAARLRECWMALAASADAVRTASAAVFADCLVQVRLESAEHVAFGGRQVGPFGHRVGQCLHLLELAAV
jgi:hypothetical protein